MINIFILFLQLWGKLMYVQQNIIFIIIYQLKKLLDS